MADPPNHAAASSNWTRQLSPAAATFSPAPEQDGIITGFDPHALNPYPQYEPSNTANLNHTNQPINAAATTTPRHQPVFTTPPGTASYEEYVHPSGSIGANGVWYPRENTPADNTNFATFSIANNVTIRASFFITNDWATFLFTNSSTNN